jgi:FkbM family methyltransferase
MASLFRSASFVVQRFVLGRRMLLARIPEYGLELRVPARDVIGRHLYKYRTHDAVISRFLATQLELGPDDLVFDVGANIGWYSLLIARIAPRGAAIHAFEPDPWVRGLLQENISRNRAGAVTVVDAAVGERPGRATLYLYGERNRGRNSLLPINRGEQIEVEVVSLDDYCRRLGLENRPVGFIKIDVEGYEFFALRGATETLRRARAVLTEFSPIYMERADLHPAAMLDLMVELGFSPFLLEDAGPRAVSREELLASGRQRDLYWTRPAGTPTPAAPDPAALAV